MYEIIDNILYGLPSYHENFRNAFFISGFTIGSFLLSMKTFIVKTMKEEFYDNEEYQEKVRQRRKLGQNVEYYGALKKFSDLLISAIVLSFISAFSQVTIGYIGNAQSSFFCVIVSFASWVLVGFSIYFLGENWSRSLQLSEDKAKNKEKVGTERING